MHEKVLALTQHPEGRSINWAGWVFASYCALVCLYGLLCLFFYSYLPQIIYLLSNIAIFCTQSYFIHKQRPENQREMEMAKKALALEAEGKELKEALKKEVHEMAKQNEELKEKAIQIEQLTDEMNDNAEKLKHKATIKQYMDTMTLQHPKLAQKLRAAASAKLTSHDILLCMLIYDGRKIAYIANLLCVNTRSVEMARSRLRKKFDLNAEDNLAEHIMKIVNDAN